MANGYNSNSIGLLGFDKNPLASGYLNNQKGSTAQTKFDTGETENPIIRTVEVTLAGKPSGMAAGEYLMRQALERIAPDYGLNSADIELEIQFVKDKKNGNFIEDLSFGGVAVKEPNKLTDKDVDALVAKGDKTIDFGIHAASVQRMLERDEIVRWLAGRDALHIPVSDEDKNDLARLGYTPEDIGKLRDAKYMQYLGYREKALAEVNEIAKQKLIAERTEYLSAHPEKVVKDGDNISASRIDFLIRAMATKEINDALTNSKMTALEYAANKKNYEQSLAELKAWEARTDNIPASSYVKEGAKNLLNSFYREIGETLKGLSVIAVNNSIQIDKNGKPIEPQASETLGYKIGDWIEQNVQAPNANKDIERTFVGGVLPKTVGGLLPAVFGAWATESPTAAVSIYDGLRTGGSIYDEAKQHGATEAQAQNAALLTGGFVGLTDRFGYGKTLETLNSGAGANAWQTIFKEAVKDGGRNAGVAGVQTIFENGVAKNIYDKDRGYLDNVRERIIAAGITGAALKGGLEIIAKVHAGSNPQVLAETQRIFKVEAENLTAKQIELRNSGIDLKAKLNAKFNAERNKVEQNSKNVTEKTLGKIQSDVNLRTEFRDNLYDYNQYAREIEGLKLKHPEIKDIPTEDLVAIRAYTAEHYEWLNDALRTGDKAGLERLRAHIICAISGLNQLPDFKGIVYRGTNLTIKQAEIYKKGEIVTEKDFKSTSYIKGAEFNGNTEFTIYSETGKKVDFLSKHPYEKEVIFKPGTKFLVLDVEIDSITKVRNISLREVKGGR